jgi:hypothetical protein
MAHISYLRPEDYAAYGIDAQSAGRIAQASDVINGFLRRPEGLVIGVDAAGRPAYMTGLEPLGQLTSIGDVPAGTNVSVPVRDLPSLSLIGEAVVLDRANASATETCSICGINTENQTLILQKVTRTHNGPVALEQGLCITEEITMPSRRSIARTSRIPIARLVGGAGRFGYGRRSDQITGHFDTLALTSALHSFTGAPRWQSFDPVTADVSAASGEVWIPGSMYLSNYTEVRLHYVAGWVPEALPSAIKQATANIVRALADSPMGAGIESLETSGMRLKRSSDSVLDSDTRRLLAPFMVRAFS